MNEVKATMSKDPVCGMMVDDKKRRFVSSYEGKDVFFCSLVCKDKFDKDPQRYAKK